MPVRGKACHAFHSSRATVQSEQLRQDQIRVADQARRDGLDDVSSQLGKISDRLNDQQAAMQAVQDENQELRDKLQEVHAVAVKSEELRQSALEELASMQAKLESQVQFSGI